MILDIAVLRFLDSELGIKCELVNIRPCMNIFHNTDVLLSNFISLHNTKLKNRSVNSGKPDRAVLQTPGYKYDAAFGDHMFFIT